MKGLMKKKIRLMRKMPLTKSVPVDIDKALKSGGLVMGSPKKPSLIKKLFDDAFGSPELNTKQREDGEKLNKEYSGQVSKRGRSTSSGYMRRG